MQFSLRRLLLSLTLLGCSFAVLRLVHPARVVIYLLTFILFGWAMGALFGKHAAGALGGFLLYCIVLTLLAKLW